jgi:hypothetical protein
MLSGLRQSSNNQVRLYSFIRNAHVTTQKQYGFAWPVVEPTPVLLFLLDVKEKSNFLDGYKTLMV